MLIILSPAGDFPHTAVPAGGTVVGEGNAGRRPDPPRKLFEKSFLGTFKNF